MLAGIALTLALAAMAQPSRAEGPYVPPPPSERAAPRPPGRMELEPPTAGETATPTATTAEAATAAATEAPTPTATETTTAPEVAATAPRQDPDVSPAARSVFSVLRGAEWGVGALAAESAGMGELSALFVFRFFALGGMLSVGGAGEVGPGVHLLVGPRVALSEHVRIDVLADGGFTFYGTGGESDIIVSQTETSETNLALLTLGARAGVTFTSPQSGYYVSLGAGIRDIRPGEVTYTVSSCTWFIGCSSQTKSTTFGGTVAGAFLTFGRFYPRR